MTLLDLFVLLLMAENNLEATYPEDEEELFNTPVPYVCELVLSKESKDE